MAGIIRKNSAGAKWIYHQVSRRDKEQVMAMRALIRHWRACGYSDAAIIAMGKEMI